MNNLMFISAVTVVVYVLGFLLTLLVCCALAWLLTDGRDIYVEWSKKPYSSAVVGSALKPKKTFIQMIKSGVS